MTARHMLIPKGAHARPQDIPRILDQLDGGKSLLPPEVMKCNVEQDYNTFPCRWPRCL